MKKRILLTSSILISSLSTSLFVVSCGSPGAINNNYIEEKVRLDKFLSENKTSIKPKGSNIEIKSFIDFRNWKSLDDLLSENYLAKYFSIEDSFKKKLIEQDYFIYKSIKRVVIEPKVGSKDLTIIFYLKEFNTDKNICSFIVADALTSNFSYVNEIGVPSSINVKHYDNNEEFEKEWKKISGNNKDLNVLKDMLDRAFNISSNDLNKIATNNFSKFFIIEKKNKSISLKIKQEGINEGYIFKNNEESTIGYSFEIASNSLIK